MIVMIDNEWYNEPEIRELIKRYQEQNRQLKVMLQQALADFAALRNNNYVADCSHYLKNGSCTGCPLDQKGGECGWIYEPEALELLGKDIKKDFFL